MSFDPVKVRNMAEDLMYKHLDDEWSFHFNTRKRALGTCDYRDKTIELSVNFLRIMNDDQIKDVILHEIAHAMTPGAGHGPLWKAYAMGIGLKNPKATADVDYNNKNIDLFKPKFVLVDADGKVCHSYSRSPSKKTFLNVKNFFVKGRKHQTLGKMQILPYNEFKARYA